MFLVWTVYSAGVTCTWRRKLVCCRLFPSTVTVSREYAVSLFFFLRREMSKAHLPDYPAALSISARLLCCSVYIREITLLHGVYPRDDHAALCISTRWPCSTVYIHEITLLQCVYPRDDHAVLCISTRLPCFSVWVHEMTMLHCVYPRDYPASVCISTRLPCFSVYIHEITLLQCAYPRDYPAALFLSVTLSSCTVCIHEITMLNCVYPASQFWNSRLISWMVWILCQQRPAKCRTVWFPIINNNKVAYARTWEVGGIITVLNLRSRYDLW